MGAEKKGVPLILGNSQASIKKHFFVCNFIRIYNFIMYNHYSWLCYLIVAGKLGDRAILAMHVEKASIKLEKLGLDKVHALHLTDIHYTVYIWKIFNLLPMFTPERLKSLWIYIVLKFIF